MLILRAKPNMDGTFALMEIRLSEALELLIMISMIEKTLRPTCVRFIQKRITAVREYPEIC